MPTELMWWGYLHSNGTVQVKRWLGDHEDYTGDCDGNPFVQRVVKPFAAPTREEAAAIIQAQLIDLPNKPMLHIGGADQR